jgi:hypothetical protein
MLGIDHSSVLGDQLSVLGQGFHCILNSFNNQAQGSFVRFMPISHYCLAHATGNNNASSRERHTHALLPEILVGLLWCSRAAGAMLPVAAQNSG